MQRSIYAAAGALVAIAAVVIPVSAQDQVGVTFTTHALNGDTTLQKAVEVLQARKAPRTQQSPNAEYTPRHASNPNIITGGAEAFPM